MPILNSKLHKAWLPQLIRKRLSYTGGLLSGYVRSKKPKV